MRSVPWEFGDIVPDYIVGQTTCALFLRWAFVQIMYMSVTVFIHSRMMCSAKHFLHILSSVWFFFIFFDFDVILALSLRYHNLNPNYIHDRLKLLGQTFTLRVLLVQVDVVSMSQTRIGSKNVTTTSLFLHVNESCAGFTLQKDPHHALKELACICIMADCTLILAWR